MNGLSPIDTQVEMTLSKAAKSDQEYVSNSVVFKQPSSHTALGLSISVSGLDDQDIYTPLGIDAGQWSRIRKGAAHFPDDKIGEFQKLVVNDIYIRWLANKCDRDVFQRKSTLEEELIAAQEKIKYLEHDSDLMRGLLTK